MFIELFVTFVAVFIIFDFITKKRRNDYISTIPGPKAYPVIGNVYMLIGRKPEGILGFMAEMHKKYGKVRRFWMFNKLMIFSTDPRDNEVVLSSHRHITKNNMYDILLGWLGAGLLLSAGQKWHSRRKAITPAFHFIILEQFVDIFNQQGQVLVEKLKSKADGKTPFNVQPFICLAALDIIAETAMGTTINAQADPNNEYTQAVNELVEIASARVAKGYTRDDVMFALLNPMPWLRQRKLIRIAHNFTESVISERRKTLEESIADGTFKPNEPIESDVGTKKRMALLDVLLQSTINGQTLSNEDIREEVDTFMFEGHDTTATAISFALYELARHPDIQKKVFEEIKQVLGPHPSIREYQDLKYTEFVIKETLRLYPSVPIIGRTFNEDFEINGKFIPAGANYMAQIYLMQRDPDNFPEPEKFIPERYSLEDGGTKIDPFAYVPFSAGPRNCIGQKFAMLEMKSIITKIVRNFEILQMGPAIQLSISVLLRSTNGIHIGLKARVE